MLKAKLDSVRKNKKGFSLIELIIVIAIMVALIAVMAPAFVKYVQKSRDAALATAAEDYATAASTYLADPETTVFPDDNSKITISWDSSAGGGGIKIEADNGCSNVKDAIDALAGVDSGKKLGKTEKVFELTFISSNGNYSCQLRDATT